MNKKSRLSAFLTVLLIGLVLEGVIRFGTVQASTYIRGIPKPSVPQFTISFEAHPYYVPPEYGIDPYTGANKTVRSGYTVKNQSMDFTIKNQPFTPYTDENGSTFTLSYSIRGKGHFEENWKEFEHFEASTSEHSVKSYPYDGNNIPNIGFVPNGGKVDYQVEARIGFYKFDHGSCREIFTGETSGWSPTLTLTIGESLMPTPSPATTPTPTIWPTPFQSPTPSPSGETQPEIGLTELVFVAIIAFALGGGLGLLIYLIKRK